MDNTSADREVNLNNINDINNIDKKNIKEEPVFIYVVGENPATHITNLLKFIIVILIIVLLYVITMCNNDKSNNKSNQNILPIKE